MAYQSFNVLVDAPAANPSLGFADLADALAQIAQQSDPRFAIGIFGDWGSGKTTLMSAIQQRLDAQPNVVTVWFNAWRYEREPHLIVPLIDQLRGRLHTLAETEADGAKSIAGKAAAALGRAGAALLRGLTVTAKLPGLDARVDFKQVMDQLGSDEEVAKRVLSFYSASFEAIREALAQFHDNGARRIVVFVDDLDRCLPTNALEVLESMKLLFDLDGFVFVVGLNQSVIERAVTTKYAASASAEDEAESQVRGRDYVKKIFQVPFGLPQVSIEQLEEYFHALIHGAGLPAEQIGHLQQHVAPHLQYLSQDGSINPREVKRILNAYIMQLKMLEPRLADTLKPDVVMTLQVLSFRPDWQRIYDKLTADAELVQTSLATAIESELSHISVYGTTYAIPHDLSTYLNQPFASALLTAPLKTYLSAAETTRSTDTRLVIFQAEMGTVRAHLEAVKAANASTQDVSNAVSRLDGFASELSRVLPTRGRVDESALRDALKALSSAEPDERAALVTTIEARLDQIDDVLFEMRRRTQVVAAS